MHRISRIVFLTSVAGLPLGIACARAAEQSATTQAALPQASSIDQILEALDHRGEDLRTLSADVRLTDTDAALGDSSSRSGKFWLENRADGSTRAHILFDRKEVDGKASTEQIEYLLDGGRLIDRNYRGKKQVTRMVLRPGEKMNLLKLGEGPFPMPIGQKPRDVHATFDVTKIDPAKDDPAGSIHLRLIPKSTTSLARKFKSVDVWINPMDEVPVRIETLDRNQTSIRRTDLANMKLNAPLNDADFALAKIDESKWDLSEESYRDDDPKPSAPASPPISPTETSPPTK